MTRKPKIIIDPDFESVFGEPDPDEVAKVRLTIERDGVIDPLILWDRDGELVLVDGHTRYRIAQELGEKCPQEIFEFRDRDAVLDYIIERQNARRNLNPAQKVAAYMRSEEFKRARAAGRKRGGGDHRSKVAPGATMKSSRLHEKVATKIGISPKTAQRIMTVLESDDEEVKQPLLKNELSPKQADAKLKAKKDKNDRENDHAAIAEEDSPKQLAELGQLSLQRYLRNLSKADDDLRTHLHVLDSEWAHLLTDDLLKCRDHLQAQLAFIDKSLAVAKAQDDQMTDHDNHTG